MKNNLLLIFLLLFTACELSQTKDFNVETKLNIGLLGNNYVQFKQRNNDKFCFIDPIDDTIHYKNVVDNIFQDSSKKTYISTVCFRPTGKDTSVFKEYLKDVTDFIDLKTYKKMEKDFFQNKGQVYMWWANSDGEYPIEVVGADPKTFVPFDSVGGGKDKQHVFYDGGPGDFKIIKGADPKTIKVLNPKRGCWNCGTCYFTDHKAVYYGLNKLRNADPKTFQLVNKDSVDAKDKYGSYFDGQLIK